MEKSIYQKAIHTALDMPFTLPDHMVDEIHHRIMREIRTKRQQLFKDKPTEKISFRKLEYDIAPILESMKEANAKRKFALHADKENGLYQHIKHEINDCEILVGHDNTSVIYVMRDWLSDFGSKNNQFSSLAWGRWKSVGNLLDETELNMDKLVPKILKENVHSRPFDEVSINPGYHFFVEPIEMKCFVHDPSEIVIDGKEVLETYTISYNDVKFKFPCCKPSTVVATVDANIEYSVTKGLQVDTWAAFLSLGINPLVFNKKVSKTFSHRLKLKVQLPMDAVKLREKVNIDVNQERAAHFIELYDHFEQITKALSGKKQRPSIQYRDCAPIPQMTILFERFPWLLFIETLRRGGVKAANELLKKKPEVLRNLPADANNALGIAFEELQIAKVMAEGIRHGVDLELIAGDGNGLVQLNNGGEIATPVYTDAVFKMKETGELFAVQFKYSDTADNLFQMMEGWQKRHANNNPDVNLPEALHFDRVQLIGPNDVLEDMVNGHFNKEMYIGKLKVSPDDRNIIETFLDQNTDLLKRIVNSPEWNWQQLKEAKDGFRTQLRNVDNALDRLQQQLANINANDNPHPNAIANIENIIQQREGDRALIEQNYNANENLMKELETKTLKMIEKEINMSYSSKNMRKVIDHEVKLNVAVQAVVDGIITLVTTSDEELRKYFRGEISLGECVKEITKSTAIATARGGAFGLGFSGITMLAHYAGLQGWASAGALSIVAKYGGPAMAAGIFMYESYNILHHWKNEDITTAEMERAFGRTVTSTALTIGGTIAAGCLIGGPVGLLVGAGIAIAVCIGDYYLGDKVWSTLIKENPEEAKAILEKKYNHLKSDVLKAAYGVFDLTEYATDEEVKEAFKSAILKYHPDKGGDAKQFHAIYAAYEFIRSQSN